MKGMFDFANINRNKIMTPASNASESGYGVKTPFTPFDFGSIMTPSTTRNLNTRATSRPAQRVNVKKSPKLDIDDLTTAVDLKSEQRMEMIALQQSKTVTSGGRMDFVIHSTKPQSS
jgi:hypothetical protein